MSATLEDREPATRYLAPPLLRHFDLVTKAPDGVARLRELTLTLAVQGKLVPQDPADEPASVLLERIREEKARLVKEGKIRKEKPLAAIGEEEKPFELPVGWAWQKLGEIGTWAIGSGFPHSAQGRPDLPILFAKVSDMNLPGNEREIVTTNHTICEQTASNIRVNIHPPGTVVFPKIGGAIATNKRRILIRPTAIDNNCLGITPSPSVTTDYLYLLLTSIDFTKYQAGTSVPALSQGALGEIVIGLPPVTEQSRIVTRVEELMALCDALEEKGRLEAAQHERLAGALFDALANSASAQEAAENWQRIAPHFDLLLDRPAAVDRLEQTILQLAVRGRLVPQDPADEPASALLQKIRAEKDRLIAAGQLKRDKPLPPISDEEKPFDLPEGWKWVTLETIAHVGTGTTPSRDNSAYFQTGSIPWVTSGETGQPFIADTSERVTQLALNETNLTLYPEGTLIVAMYGQGKTRGQISELLIEATTNQACAAIVLVERHADHRAYVKLVFEKSYDEIRELSAGGAQPNLNVGKVKTTGIPLPPLAEQSRIVARVAELRALCAQLRARLTTAAQTQSRLAEALLEQAVA